MSFNLKYIKSIIIASCIMMLFAACKSNNKNTQLLEYNGKFPDESAENMTITVSDSGRTIFIVNTPILNRYNGEDSSFVDCPEGILITSYNDYGHKQAIITAGYACQVNNNLFRATDNVVIYDLSNGDSVITDEVIWDQRRRSIYSTKAVKQIKRDGSINYGDGFDADERFTKYTIIHPHGEMVGYDF